jgi:hypothetical protein
MALTQPHTASSPSTAWQRFAVAADPELRRFEAALRSPGEAQLECLRRILRANAGTAFGRAHGFGAVATAEDFRNRVPESDWSAIESWVGQTKAGEKAVLTQEPTMHFQRTSGSGAARKDMPYTQGLLREFQRALVVWLAALRRDLPAIAGPSYWSLSPDRTPPEDTAAGIPVGSASDAAYLEGCAAEELLSTVVGAHALGVDRGDWQLETLRSLVAEPELRLLSVWSPTFLTSLLDRVLDPARGAASIAALERALPRERFDALAAAVRARDFTRLWPQLAAISCWTDGPSTRFAAALADLFPGTRILPKGLFATEGVVSLPWGASEARPAAITSHFLEFVDERGAARTVEELELGQRYRPLLTTSGGLYRYRLGDVVEVSNFIERTPCLRFFGREDSRSDLVGEKLDEGIVARALHSAGVAGPAVLVPDADARPPRYLLIAEAPDGRAAAAVEAELWHAHHYGIARRNGQLAAVACCRVDHLATRLHDAWEAIGRRSGDAKAAALIVAPDFARALIRGLPGGGGCHD